MGLLEGQSKRIEAGPLSKRLGSRLDAAREITVRPAANLDQQRVEARVGGPAHYGSHRVGVHERGPHHPETPVGGKGEGDPRGASTEGALRSRTGHVARGPRGSHGLAGAAKQDRDDQQSKRPHPQCGVPEVREPPRVPRRRILQGATTRHSNAMSRRRNAAGPDASVLEWPRHFWDTTLPTSRTEELLEQHPTGIGQHLPRHLDHVIQSLVLD